MSKLKRFTLFSLAGLIVFFTPLASIQAPVLHYSLAKTTENQKVLAGASAFQKTELPKQETLLISLTAYSSSPEETDSTPFITASNSRVRFGIVAANFLPFGSLIKIPKFFGDKIFVVEDRLHSRKKGFVDVWMPTKDDAKRFGLHTAEIIVIRRAK